MSREQMQNNVLELVQSMAQEEPMFLKYGIPLFRIPQCYLKKYYPTVNGNEEDKVEAEVLSVCLGLKENKFIEYTGSKSKGPHPKVFLTEKGKDMLMGETRFSRKTPNWVTINADTVFAQIGGVGNVMNTKIADSFKQIYTEIDELENHKEIRKSVEEIEQEIQKPQGNKETVLKSLGNIAKTGADAIVEKLISVLIDKALGLK